MKFLTFTLISFYLISTVHTDFEKVQYQPNESLELSKYLNELQKSILSHDQRQLMSFIDPLYIKDQHDEFLEGRTRQFLNELFYGNTVDGKEFVGISFHSIKKIKIIHTVKERENGFRVYFLISNNHYTIVTDKYIINSGNRYWLIGNVG